MKKFVFTLGKMLDYKDQVLSKEKGILSKLRAQKLEMENTVEQLEQDLIDCDHRLKEKSRSGISVLEIRQYDFLMNNIRSEIKRLQGEILLKDRQIAQQMERVVIASQEVSGLEKLKEKQLEEYQAMVQKTETLMIEEFVSSKLVRESLQDQELQV